MIGNLTPSRHIKYIRENWKEWFVIQMTDRGLKCPRFYLPLRYNGSIGQKACWIFPLAPFVLFFYILRDSLSLLWYDLNEALDLIKKEKDFRNNNQTKK